MDAASVLTAARALRDATVAGRPLDELPDGCRPETIAEGHAVQNALLEMLGEPVVAYKVAGLDPGKVMRGAVIGPRLFSSPAAIPAASVPLLGVESEIAFRFERDFPTREAEYTYDEVADAVVALPTIEVVSSRFTDYKSTPVLHRLGDCMSNGALVCGATRADWRDFDFATIDVTLRGNGTVMAHGKGGHSTVDPLLPAVALANALRGGRGLTAGQIITTGTFTGLIFAEAGARVEAEFRGFGSVELHLTA